MKVLIFMDKSAKLTALCRQSASNPVQAVISAAAAAVGSILHTYWRLLKSSLLFAQDSHKVLNLETKTLMIVQQGLIHPPTLTSIKRILEQKRYNHAHDILTKTSPSPCMTVTNCRCCSKVVDKVRACLQQDTCLYLSLRTKYETQRSLFDIQGVTYHFHHTGVRLPPIRQI